MLRLRVIEESRSACSSPVILVPKPDGTFRFCNDFRRLNEVSEFDAYPMPRVDEWIERLGPARYLTTLDLTKGYWQVPLTQTAWEKREFATPGGLYQYTVLPFGVHGAPARFQRMMDQLLVSTWWWTAYTDNTTSLTAINQMGYTWPATWQTS